MAENMETIEKVPAPAEQAPIMDQGAAMLAGQIPPPMDKPAEQPPAAPPITPITPPILSAKEITVTELQDMITKDDPALKSIMADKEKAEKLANGDFSVLEGFKIKPVAAAPEKKPEDETPAAVPPKSSVPVDDETLGSKSKKQLRDMAKNRGEAYLRVKQENASLMERLNALENATKKNIPVTPPVADKPPAVAAKDDAEPSFDGLEPLTEEYTAREKEWRQWNLRQNSKRDTELAELRKTIEATRNIQSDTTTAELQQLRGTLENNEQQLYAMEISDFQEGVPELQTERHPLDVMRDLNADKNGSGGDFSRKVSKIIPEITKYEQVYEMLRGETDNAKRWKAQLQAAGVAIPGDYMKVAKLAEVEGYRNEHAKIKRNDKGQIVSHEPIAFDKAYLLMKLERGELQADLKQEQIESVKRFEGAVEKAKRSFAPEIPPSKVNADNGQSPEYWTDKQLIDFAQRIQKMDAWDLKRNPKLLETYKIVLQRLGPMQPTGA